jgi:outer membrane protein OmpA-like peptidoglycan-associated protein
MNNPIKNSRQGLAALLAGLSIAAMCIGAWAQEADGPVLKGNKVTESNLLDALTPPPEPVVTRSLKVTRDNSAGVLAPKKRPSASLLITFETNSSELTENARKQLDVVAAALKNDRLADYTFSVEGHADPRGSADANLVLSQQRAESVRTYLVTTHQIAADRLKAEGKGDRDLMNRAFPAAPENRRVTIVTLTQ